MKNQPNGPGCGIAFISCLLVAFVAAAYGVDKTWSYFAMTISLIGILMFAFLLRREKEAASQRASESADVLEAVYGMSFHIEIYDIVSDRCHDGFLRWKQGWNLDRVNREYLDLEKRGRQIFCDKNR